MPNGFVPQEEVSLKALLPKLDRYLTQNETEKQYQREDIQELKETMKDQSKAINSLTKIVEGLRIYLKEQSKAERIQRENCTNTHSDVNRKFKDQDTKIDGFAAKILIIAGSCTGVGTLVGAGILWVFKDMIG